MYKSTVGNYTVDIKNSIFNNNSGKNNAMYMYYLTHVVTMDNITISNNRNG